MGGRTSGDDGVTARTSVIVELRVGAGEFELGRILDSARDLDVELETMVPLGRQPVPFFVVHDEVGEAFESRVGSHPSVESITEIERYDGEVTYALDWDASRDRLFEAIDEAEAQLKTARTTGDDWRFELRFPSHEALSRFGDLCEDADIDVTLDSIYNPTRPESGPWFGLTGLQRETLVRAVEGGYYAIPRRMSTNDLAAEFDISDQAITERLRRAIAALVRNTLLVDDGE